MQACVGFFLHILDSVVSLQFPRSPSETVEGLRLGRTSKVFSPSPEVFPGGMNTSSSGGCTAFGGGLGHPGLAAAGMCPPLVWELWPHIHRAQQLGKGWGKPISDKGERCKSGEIAADTD